LGQVSRLLDGGFSGLCVHEVPQLKLASQGKVRRKEWLRNFSIGLLLGPSGSGKTTLSREQFGEPLTLDWDLKAPALAHFQSLSEASEALEAVHLNPQVAMRPVEYLSGGERERLCLAWGLAEWAAGRRETLVIDEFTSLLDRQTGKIVARGVTDFVRSRPALRGLVLMSCHFDIVGRDLLEPDWTYECSSSRLAIFSQVARDAVDPALGDGSSAREDVGGAGSATDCSQDVKRRRICGASVPACPSAAEARLIVRRAWPSEWKHFREHHYKDHRLNQGTICFVAELDGRAVAFTAIIYTGFKLIWLLGRHDPVVAEIEAAKLGIPRKWVHRHLLREHRTVVLPDAQGFGLGSLMSDTVARIAELMNHSFMSTTAHPTYGGYRNRSPFWGELPSSLRVREDGGAATFSHVWSGAGPRDGPEYADKMRMLSERVHVDVASIEEEISRVQQG